MTPRTRRILERAQDLLSNVRTRIALLLVQCGFAFAAFVNGNTVTAAILATLAAVDLWNIME